MQHEEALRQAAAAAEQAQDQRMCLEVQVVGSALEATKAVTQACSAVDAMRRQLQGKLSDMNAALASTIADKETAEAQVKQLQTELDALVAELEAAMALQAQLEFQVELKDADLEASKEKLTELSDELKNTDDKLKGAEATIEELKRQHAAEMQALEDAMRSISDAADGADRERARLSAQLEGENLSRSQMAEKLADCAAQLQQMQAARDALECEVVESTKAATVAVAQTQGLVEQELVKAVNTALELHKTKQELSASEAALAAESKQVADLMREHQAALVNLGQAQTTIAELQSLIAALEGEVSDEKAGRNTDNNQAAVIQDKLKGDIARLEARLSELQANSTFC